MQKYWLFLSANFYQSASKKAVALFCSAVLLLPAFALAHESIVYLETEDSWSAAAEAASLNLGSEVVNSLITQNDTTWLNIHTHVTAGMLYLPTINLNSYEIYGLNSPGILSRGGIQLSADQEPFWQPEFFIPIEASWGSEFLLRIEHPRGATIPITLESPESEIRFNTTRLISDGIYYGAIGLMSIFALLFWVFNRDPHSGRLSILLVTWLATVIASWGYGDMPESSPLPTILAALSTAFILVAGLVSSWFCWHFLKESAKDSWTLKGLQFCMFANVAVLAVGAILGFNNSLASLTFIGTGFFAVSTAVVAAWRGDAAAKYLVAAAIFTTIPFVFLFTIQATQQLVIFVGILALVMVMLALLQRMSERMRQLDLRAEVAGERERFLASLSHEIRTPLNGIIGFSELCNQEPLQGNAKNYFEHIARSSKMLLNIVNEVLDYSKLEANEVNINSIPSRLKEILDDVQTIITPMAMERQVDFQVGVEDSVAAFVLIDPHRCAQVLINLSSNAVKFSEGGQVRINVSVVESELQFKVMDNGIGIDSKVLDGLFNPFRQAGPSIAREFGGSGLGLAISRQLAELLGGSLSATSKLGEGSTFYFRIPYVETSAPEKAEPINVDTQSLEGLSVLLAEDNSVNRLLACSILQKSGIHVDEAVDGEVAVSKAL
ncbi:MAG: hypothetical protein GKR91_09170 [Pseudomonadales bacterium]|nr:hypothetical protein [Pseudomonadales bacterium]